MTPWQWTALLKPCARAWEAIDPDFSRDVRLKSEIIRAILTVNK